VTKLSTKNKREYSPKFKIKNRGKISKINRILNTSLDSFSRLIIRRRRWKSKGALTVRVRGRILPRRKLRSCLGISKGKNSSKRIKLSISPKLSASQRAKPPPKS
jgi:hypothetical protein